MKCQKPDAQSGAKQRQLSNRSLSVQSPGVFLASKKLRTFLLAQDYTENRIKYFLLGSVCIEIKNVQIISKTKIQFNNFCVIELYINI